jgi:hypothetical protein
VAPYGVDNYRGSPGPSEFFVRDGYIFAYCDVRGRGKSEGTFEHVRSYIPDKTTRSQIDEARPSDFQKATQRVYRSAMLASGIRVDVLPPATGSADLRF